MKLANKLSWWWKDSCAWYSDQKRYLKQLWWRKVHYFRTKQKVPPPLDLRDLNRLMRKLRRQAWKRIQ